jgi:transposase
MYINPENTSKRFYRCGYITKARDRVLRCVNYGLKYIRDLEATINIAYAFERYGMRWGAMPP